MIPVRASALLSLARILAWRSVPPPQLIEPLSLPFLKDSFSSAALQRDTHKDHQKRGRHYFSFHCVPPFFHPGPGRVAGNVVHQGHKVCWGQLFLLARDVTSLAASAGYRHLDQLLAKVIALLEGLFQVIQE